VNVRKKKPLSHVIYKMLISYIPYPLDQDKHEVLSPLSLHHQEVLCAETSETWSCQMYAYVKGITSNNHMKHIHVQSIRYNVYWLIDSKQLYLNRNLVNLKKIRWPQKLIPNCRLTQLKLQLKVIYSNMKI
jgi:hypothetical protein